MQHRLSINYLLIPMFIGLIITFGTVAVFGVTDNQPHPNVSTLCTGVYLSDPPEGEVTVETGYPLRIPTIGYYNLNGCDDVSNGAAILHTSSYTSMFATWQFYADWLCWTLFAYGLYLLYKIVRKKSSAHTRD